MIKRVTQSDLQAYLDEALPSEQMAAIEAELRKKPELLKQLAAINARRDAGVHSVGEIWRRQRLSCPSREQLGSYLLGALDGGHTEYVEFHVRKVGCRFCQANLETGDPVEVLPVSTVPIFVKDKGQVFQYHPQTEALLQWFEIGNPSNAIGGAFSYPDTTALPQAATPCPF